MRVWATAHCGRAICMNCPSLMTASELVEQLRKGAKVLVLDVLGSRIQAYGPAYGNVVFEVPIPVEDILRRRIFVYQVEAIGETQKDVNHVIKGFMSCFDS